MPKERNFNPVQAQRKADKAKEIRKGRAEAQERRNEKFARKNPERIQKQIDDLKAITTNGGKLSKHEEQVLEGLDKELKAVRKARETLGDKAPTFGRGFNKDRDGGGGQGGVLGKRRRFGDNGSSSDEGVPEDVRNIPMPRDTPPPIPKEILDEWYSKRRARRAAENQQQHGEARQQREERKPRDAPVVESKTVYSAAPISRNLRQEAVEAFVPTAVKLKMNKGQGQGGLIEPEEADKLEQEGYLKTTNTEQEEHPPRTVSMEEVEDEEG